MYELNVEELDAGVVVGIADENKRFPTLPRVGVSMFTIPVSDVIGAIDQPVPQPVILLFPAMTSVIAI